VGSTPTFGLGLPDLKLIYRHGGWGSLLYA
jgi:hypothetical protein